jgi:hypothetical protein
MLQITPILGDNLNQVIPNVVPILAQNLASKNSEIQDMASNILDVFVEYLGECKTPSNTSFNLTKLTYLILKRWCAYSTLYEYSPTWKRAY